MADLRHVSPGVIRVSWADRAPLEDVRRAINEALRAAETHRVEAHIDLDDIPNQRMATFAGLRREGVARGIAGGEDRIVYARLATDEPIDEPGGFRALLNSFLPRKRAISQMLVRSTDGRVLLCELTYKRDWDLPGGVVEVGESPQLAVTRELHEELGLEIEAGKLLLTDWLPPWGGWDDAVCLVFDGGEHDPALLDHIVGDNREIKSADFVALDDLDRCADFTARRVHSALANLAGGPSYVESGG